MFSTFLVSILVSGLFSAALLALLRWRLTRQFQEIRRNFGYVREILKSLDVVVKALNAMQRDRASVETKVDRLSLGVTRFQENTARRLAPLEPLSREQCQVGWRRELSERESHRLLREWSDSFALKTEEADVRWLLRALKRTESRWFDDIPADAVDVLARVLAVSSLNAADLRIVDAGPNGGLLPLFLAIALEGRFPTVKIVHLSSGNGSPAVWRGNSSANFNRAAAAAGIPPLTVMTASSPAAVREQTPLCEVLLLSAGKIGALASADLDGLLSGVTKSGIVLLGCEDAPPESLPLEEIAARFEGFAILSSCGKTLALSRRS